MARRVQYSLCDKSRENWGQGFREIILLDHMVQSHKNTIEARDSFDLLFALRKGQEDGNQASGSHYFIPFTADDQGNELPVE